MATITSKKDSPPIGRRGVNVQTILPTRLHRPISEKMYKTDTVEACR
jgi:hypothetical protein